MWGNNAGDEIGGDPEELRDRVSSQRQGRMIVRGPSMLKVDKILKGVRLNKVAARIISCVSQTCSTESLAMAICITFQRRIVLPILARAAVEDSVANSGASCIISLRAPFASR